MNVVLVAEESAGLQSLRLLAASPHRVVAVMARPSDDPASGALWNHARRMGYVTWPAKFVKHASFAEELCRHDVDLLLNVHSLYVIHGDVLRACHVAAFNLHPGPLPERAGINVPSWSIFEGQSEHGVTLHEMVSEIDAGMIAYQARFPIEPTDTGMTLMSKCVRQGVPLIKRLLEDVARRADGFPRFEQDFSLRRYFDRSVPNDGWIDWDRPAADVVNHIRAADYSPFSSPWGHPLTRLGDRIFGLVKAQRSDRPCDVTPGTVGETDGPCVLVASNDEWVAVKTVEINGRYLPALEILASGERLVGRMMPVMTDVLV